MVRKVLRLIDDLAGAIQDAMFWVVYAFSYFAAGLLIVGLPIWLLAKVLEWISAVFM